MFLALRPNPVSNLIEFLFVGQYATIAFTVAKLHYKVNDNKNCKTK